MSLRLAILVSRRGSNMESILRAIKEGELDAKVEIVISNNPQALALATARKYGVHAIAVDNKGLSRQEHEERVLRELAEYEIDLIVLAGYMRILTSNFLQRFKHRDGYFKVINIHPSLLPAFPGASAYEEAFKYGVLVSGITVHLADEKVDHGPILAQETFSRLETDTLDTFKARGLAVEHKLYPKVLQAIAKNGIRLLPDKEMIT